MRGLSSVYDGDNSSSSAPDIITPGTYDARVAYEARPAVKLTPESLKSSRKTIRKTREKRLNMPVTQQMGGLGKSDITS